MVVFLDTGVLGFLTDETAKVTLPKNVAAYRFPNAGVTGVALVDSVRAAGADVFAIVGHLPARQNDDDTITGEVVDLACYIAHPETGRGAGHRKCADTCLKKGMPMGILTEDKQVFLLLEDHDNPKPYDELKKKAAETVTVEGTKVSQGGVQGFVVGAVK